jgi:hypothetical protein
LNAEEDADALAVPEWLPGVPDEPPTPRELVGVGVLPEVFPPVAPTPTASTPVAPSLVFAGPEDEPVLSPAVPLVIAEFDPVTVARVLAPVIEPLMPDPAVVELPASEAPEVDPAELESPELESPVVNPLESPVRVLPAEEVWVLPPVTVGVGEVAVESEVEPAAVLVAVLSAVVVAAVNCVVVLAAVVVTPSQKLSHWENDGSRVCEYTSDGVEAQ